MTSTNQTLSRARVLRLVADNIAFIQVEFNSGILFWPSILVISGAILIRLGVLAVIKMTNEK